MAFSSNIPLQSNQVSISLDIPPIDHPEFNSILSLTFKKVIDSLNTKEGAYYLLQELANFNQFFVAGNPLRYRNGYRRVFQLDPASLTFNHNITGIVQVTNYWAIANTATDFRKVPFTSTTLITDQISMTVTTTQVIITNGATAPPITGGIVVLEYLKE